MFSRCVLFSWIKFHFSLSPKKEKYPKFLTRYCQAAGFCLWILLKYRKFWLPAYGYFLPNIQTTEAITLHRFCAEKVKQFCKSKGGLFIKLGQYAGSLQNVLPREYLQELSTLEDQAENVPVQDLLQVLQSDLGSFCILLTNISEKPIGSASIAQVHLARILTSSTVVAVKVQKPNTLVHFTQDLRFLEMVLSVYQFLKGGYEPAIWKIFAEFCREIQEEMNFMTEMANNRRLAQCFQGNIHIHVPDIFPNLCSRRILTMEFIDGMKIDDCLSLDKETRFRISRTLHEAFARMMFQRRFLHMDPHPGNIILQWPQDERQFRIVLIDTGKCYSIDLAFTRNLANFLIAIALRDTQRLARFVNTTGDDCGMLLASLFLGRKMAQHWLLVDESEIDNRQHKYSLEDYIHLLTSIHPQWLTVLRPLLVIRGISRKLGYPKDVSTIYAPFATQLLFKAWSKTLLTYSRENYSVRNNVS
ncbi:hypothetical protein GpartN1_g6943.t1 [Galdieria partita]|uniref:ABC1 atypical kinase-like domain-containing protein n=1 Tax=Galdieria partita TaxID=83374 RepID=A0A9C7Q3W9_9RHOD|nr:hypothetical protein GpartN1_g6943.t1 [Galdieria partita]